RIATPVAATYGSARVASRSASRPIAPSIAAPDATSARRPDHRPSATMTTPPASTEAPWVRASSPNAVARASGGASTSSTPTTSAASRSSFGCRHEMRGTARTSAIVMTPKAAVEASNASGAEANDAPGREPEIDRRRDRERLDRDRMQPRNDDQDTCEVGRRREQGDPLRAAMERFDQRDRAEHTEDRRRREPDRRVPYGRGQRVREREAQTDGASGAAGGERDLARHACETV